LFELLELLELRCNVAYWLAVVAMALEGILPKPRAALSGY
jgi:hypothetical protein